MSAATSQQHADAPEQPAHRSHPGPVRIGVGGPVGAGKTQLIERITRAMSQEVSMAAVTNDIYTIEDAKILAASFMEVSSRMAVCGQPPVSSPTMRSTGRTP